MEGINEKRECKELNESLLPHTYDDVPSTRAETRERGRLLKRSNARSLISYHDLSPYGYFGFIRDGFTTVLNFPWYAIIFIFCTTYIFSWIVFGLLWWWTDDLYRTQNNYTCVSNVDSFTSAFLFSIETQVTIGYGFRVVSEDCKFGVVVLLVQCLLGLLIDSFLLGLIFAKITRPRNRRKTILFSNLAIIRSVNDNKYFEFRIADVRRSQLVEAHVRATLYWYRKDEESDELLLEQHDLDLGYDTGRDRLLLLAPIIVRHHITDSSPLSVITNENMLLQQDLEIVVALEGIVESTGLTVQALWSFTEREIKIGYKFKPMMHRRKGVWEVNFSLLGRLIKDT